MPELPDLQVFSRNLSKAFKGKTLHEVIITNHKKLKLPVAELQKAITGHKLNKVERAGKELRFEFNNGHVLGMHLMLHGQLFLSGDEKGKKYRIVELKFENGEGLVLTDFQGMAAVTLDPEDTGVPDALTADFDYIRKKAASTRTAIKTLLLDQHFIRGIGNAYADEILWDARLSPFSAADKIPGEKLKELLRSIKTVLEDAEKQILKTHPDIISGEIRDFLKVHQPKKKQTPSGAAIHQKPVGSRKTYYTDEQELFE